MRTRNLITQNVLISQDASIRDAMTSLKESGKGIVIAVDNLNKVVGVLTAGDVRDHFIENELKDDKISNVMNKNFVHLPENFKRELLLKILDNSKINEIPVLNSNGHLVDLLDRSHRRGLPPDIARARTPARISLSGGGTDFTGYFMDNGGAGLSCTIAKYSHALLRKRNDNQITIFSNDFKIGMQFENYDNLNYDGSLDLIKAAIKIMRPSYGFDLEVGCDFPPASGLGGSASLVASIIGCLNEFHDRPLSKYDIAEYAFEVERLELEIAGGWQDQYSTVFGGLNYLEFDRSHNTVMPLRLEDDAIRELEESMILCHTGETHLGATMQIKNYKNNSTRQFHKDAMAIKEITNKMRIALLRGEINAFAKLLSESWIIKKRSNPDVSTPQIDACYDLALNCGALGGRLLGTGGGGYFIFIATPFRKYELLNSLREKGFKVESVIMDLHGLRSWRTNHEPN